MYLTVLIAVGATGADWCVPLHLPCVAAVSHIRHPTCCHVRSSVPTLTCLTCSVLIHAVTFNHMPVPPSSVQRLVRHCPGATPYLSYSALVQSSTLHAPSLFNTILALPCRASVRAACARPCARPMSHLSPSPQRQANAPVLQRVHVPGPRSLQGQPPAVCRG